MNMFVISSMEDALSEDMFPPDSVHPGSLERQAIVIRELHKLVSRVVDLSIIFSEDTTEDNGKETDTVYEYAKEVMSLGLLLMEFNDAIREGDGNRILRCWQFFLPLFKASDKTNYSIEAFTLQAQEKYLLSTRLAMQLKWSRTINVHGQRGKNIAAAHASSLLVA